MLQLTVEALDWSWLLGITSWLSSMRPCKSPVTRDMRWARVSAGLFMVVADRPRSHKGQAGVLAAIGVDCCVFMAECRRGIVDGEFSEWNERRPIRLLVIYKSAKHGIDTLSA